MALVEKRWNTAVNQGFGMKKILVSLALLVAVVVVTGFVFRDQLGMVVAMYFAAPDEPFDEWEQPETPSYADKASWAALPELEEGSDLRPDNLVIDDMPPAERANLFFVHPTTFYSTDNWNQSIADENANKLTNDWVMRDQASIFNSCCNVFAPRYRQATLFSFYAGEDGQKALDLAYEDVKRAFNYFMENYNKGGPFILASHSQGSLHLDRLLKEEISGSELLSQMVAAYPIGFPIDESNGIPVCESSLEVGCQVSWNTYKESETDNNNIDFMTAGAVICVNPLTWKRDNLMAPATQNLGAISFSNGATLEKGLTGARCEGNKLLVKQVEESKYPDRRSGLGAYHNYDYSLFHLNIRKNAVERLKQFRTLEINSDTLMSNLMQETGS